MWLYLQLGQAKGDLDAAANATMQMIRFALEADVPCPGVWWWMEMGSL